MQHVIALLLISLLTGCSQQSAEPAATGPQPIDEPPSPVAAPRSAEPVTKSPLPPPARNVQPPRQAAPVEPAKPPETTPEPDPEPEPPEAPPEEPDQSAEEPAEEEDEPKRPKYLPIVTPRAATAPFEINSQLQSPRTVRIETRNVGRFRITRRHLPLRTSDSIVLRVDGQVFEWTRRRTQLDLVYSPASGWSVVPEGERP